jgi:hypothetical protein
MSQDKRIDIFKLLKNEDKLTKVLVYIAQETIADPYEKNKTLNYIQPVAIDALVQQITPSSLRWKYWGQLPQESIQIICELRHENTLIAADKIEVNNKLYKVYKDDSSGFGILKRIDYLIVVLQRKANE